ncbi:MAG TPA: PDZ domain-containing protein [Pyrinomonadaceae bacterium]|jgi:serine protease Do|nr:PDZ domain-containing protein [Pyrinomonadaceae bacterium]
MKRKALLGLSALALLASTVVFARAQDVPPAPPALSTPPAAQAPPTPPVVAQAPAPPAGFATTLFDNGNYLGVHVEDVTRENAGRYNLTGEPRGVGVREVVKGSPAERAGLRAGDVILRFDGEAATSVRKLNRLIEEAAPEHAARLTVLRNGSEQEVSATLGRREPFMRADGGLTVVPFNSDEARRFGEEWKNNSEEWQRRGEEMRKHLEEMQRAHPGVLAFGGTRHIGVATSPLGQQLAQYFGVSHGVLVNSVESNSPAERAGLKAGDVITEADGQQVNDAGDLVRALGGKDGGEVTLTVTRERKQHKMRVKPERGGPQGLYINPGALRVVTPVAPLAPLRGVVAPRALSVPRVVTVPRVRVAPALIRVLGSDERIL